MALTEREELELLELEEREAASNARPQPQPETPKPSERPSLGERITRAVQPEPFVRGAFTGFVGGPGELEKFGAYTVPRAFGFQREPQQFLGRETLFPTTEEVSRGLESIGVRKPTTGTGYETAGEITGGLLSLAPAVGRLGQRVYGSDLVQGLLGRKTRQAQQQVGEEAAKLSGLSAAQLAEAASEEARLLARSRAAQAQQTQRLGAQPAQAAEAAAKAERQAGAAVRELAGVGTRLEAGAFRPIPQTSTQVGDFVRQQADTFVTNIKQRRDERAKELFGGLLDQVNLAQGAGRFADTKPVIDKLDLLISKGGTQDYINSLLRLKDDVQKTKNFEGLEVIRRKLGDAAFGVPEEGYKAIGQQFAGDMRDLVTQSMKKYSDDLAGKEGGGLFGQYLSEYKRLSDPIRVYSTKVGKGILNTEDAGGKYFSKTGEQIANDMFSSPENYRKFVDAVGGNKQVTEAAARRFFAGLLEGKTKVADVEKVFKNYRAVLSEMPMVAEELSGRYLQQIRRAEATTKAAPEVAKRATEGVKAVEQQFKAVDEQVAKRMNDIAESKTIFSDSVKALNSAKPTDILRTFEETVLPKIRAAETKAGRSLITPENEAILRRQIEATQRIADQTQRNRIIATIVGTYLLGQNLTSRGSQVLGD